MRMIQLLAAILLVGTLLVPASATAQDFDPDEFTPYGYTYCGIKFFGESGWLLDPGDQSGASQIAFASGLSCQAARRNSGRIVYSRRGQPKAPGYRCRYMRQGYEFSDVRCAKKGGSGAKFRVQSGS